MNVESSEAIRKRMDAIAQDIRSAKSIDDLWDPAAALLYWNEYLRQYGESNLRGLKRGITYNSFFLTLIENELMRATPEQVEFRRVAGYEV